MSAAVLAWQFGPAPVSAASWADGGGVRCCTWVNGHRKVALWSKKVRVCVAPVPQQIQEARGVITASKKTVRKNVRKMARRKAAARARNKVRVKDDGFGTFGFANEDEGSSGAQSFWDDGSFMWNPSDEELDEEDEKRHIPMAVIKGAKLRVERPWTRAQDGQDRPFLLDTSIINHAKAWSNFCVRMVPDKVNDNDDDDEDDEDDEEFGEEDGDGSAAEAGLSGEEYERTESFSPYGNDDEDDDGTFKDEEYYEELRAKVASEGESELVDEGFGSSEPFKDEEDEEEFSESGVLVSVSDSGESTQDEENMRVVNAFQNPAAMVESELDADPAEDEVSDDQQQDELTGITDDASDEEPTAAMESNGVIGIDEVVKPDEQPLVETGVGTTVTVEESSGERAENVEVGSSLLAESSSKDGNGAAVTTEVNASGESAGEEGGKSKKNDLPPPDAQGDRFGSPYLQELPDIPPPAPFVVTEDTLVSLEGPRISGHLEEQKLYVFESTPGYVYTSELIAMLFDWARGLRLGDMPERPPPPIPHLQAFRCQRAMLEHLTLMYKSPGFRSHMRVALGLLKDPEPYDLPVFKVALRKNILYSMRIYCWAHLRKKRGVKMFWYAERVRAISAWYRSLDEEGRPRLPISVADAQLLAHTKIIVPLPPDRPAWRRKGSNGFQPEPRRVPASARIRDDWVVKAIAEFERISLKEPAIRASKKKRTLRDEIVTTRRCNKIQLLVEQREFKFKTGEPVFTSELLLTLIDWMMARRLGNKKYCKPLPITKKRRLKSWDNIQVMTEDMYYSEGFRSHLKEALKLKRVPDAEELPDFRMHMIDAYLRSKHYHEWWTNGRNARWVRRSKLGALRKWLMSLDDRGAPRQPKAVVPLPALKLENTGDDAAEGAESGEAGEAAELSSEVVGHAPESLDLQLVGTNSNSPALTDQPVGASQSSASA